MAKTFYKALISYKDENDQSKFVVKKTNILVEAISYSEAEKVAYQLFLDEINPCRLPKEWQKTGKINDFKIVSLFPQEVEDIVFGENDSKGQNLQWWHRGKVQLIDGNTKSTVYFYVSGDELSSASIRLKKFLDENYKAVECKIHSVIFLPSVTGIFEYDPEVVAAAVALEEDEKKERLAEDQKMAEENKE